MILRVNPEKRCAELECIIADAIAALDERRLGDLRRILTKGNSRPVMAKTEVIARNAT